jgi:iron complex outermembrane receptor protein
MPSKILTPFLCLCLLLLAATGLEAADDDPLSLDSITVTAQKRAEYVQEVPVSIDVIDERTVEEKGIRQFMDLGTLVPNLTVSSSGGAATYAYLGMRGRVNSSGGDMDPTVTVMLDGVAFDDFNSVASLPMFDIERIEVLRGPQSTLYGFNSEAGVINVITRKPGPDARARFGLTFGDGRDSDFSYGVQGAFSAPVVRDVLSVGLSFNGAQDGSYINNIHADDDYARNRRSAVRFSAVLTPAEAFEATLNVGFSQVKADNGYISLPRDLEAARLMGWTSFNKWEADIDAPEYSRVKNFTADLNMRLKTGPVDLVSITSWRTSEQDYLTDFDLGAKGAAYDLVFPSSPPGLAMEGSVDNRYRTFMQEFRLMSPEDDPSNLEWIVGLFYRHSERQAKMGMEMFMSGVSMDMPMADTTLDLNDFAVFGQATYRLFDKRLGLTLGLRQDWTSREMEDRIYFIGEKFKKSDSQLIPKFSVDYRG